MASNCGKLALVMLMMRKVYVKVVIECSPEGQVTPLRMEYQDRWFDIDRLLRVERRGADSGGGGLRYTVRIWGQTRYLWREGDRWFVEVPA